MTDDLIKAVDRVTAATLALATTIERRAVESDVGIRDATENVESRYEGHLNAVEERR